MASRETVLPPQGILRDQDHGAVLAPSDVLLVEEIKGYLGPGVWLDDRQARLRFAGRVLLAQAILIVLSLLGGRLVNLIERAFH